MSSELRRIRSELRKRLVAEKQLIIASKSLALGFKANDAWRKQINEDLDQQIEATLMPSESDLLIDHLHQRIHHFENLIDLCEASGEILLSDAYRIMLLELNAVLALV